MTSEVSHGSTADRGAPRELAGLHDTEPGGDLDQESAQARLHTRMFGGATELVRVGRFTLLERIGAGAMGVVYAGYDETLDRKVAIKVIGARALASRDARARMLREAQTLAKLSHPNVAAWLRAHGG